MQLVVHMCSCRYAWAIHIIFVRNSPDAILYLVWLTRICPKKGKKCLWFYHIQTRFELSRDVMDKVGCFSLHQSLHGMQKKHNLCMTRTSLYRKSLDHLSWNKATLNISMSLNIQISLIMKMSLDVRIPQYVSELKKVFEYKNVSEYNIFNFEQP